MDYVVIVKQKGFVIMTGKILLTSAGFENINIGNTFVKLLNRPVAETKILFIPTAAIFAEALRMVGKCIDELYRIGIRAENIIVYNLDRHMPLSEIETYDTVYFTGGDPRHLLRKVKEVDFAPVIMSFVTNGGIFVGVSAGSILATDISLVNCRFTGLHCPDGSPIGPLDLTSCPDVRLTDYQGILIDDSGSTIID